jgi:hypothetical protein
MDTDSEGRGALRASCCAQRSPTGPYPYYNVERSRIVGKDLKRALTPSLSHPMGEGGRRPGEGFFWPWLQLAALDPSVSIRG